jgi:dTDP-glucose pyrophosphorylase/predicted transcriptional regulator
MTSIDVTWQEARVPPTTSIRDALLVMSQTRLKIALVVDAENRLLGTVADGDVRRSILNGITADQLVTEIMHPEPSTVAPGATRADQIEIMHAKQVQHLPIVESDGRLIGLVSMDQLLVSELPEKPNCAVLLVGGLGSRLKPLTDERPKPLIPIGGRPVLETIVRQLRDHGIRHLYFAVNHMADAIKDHFGNGNDMGVRIDYLEEDRPLGTAGPLGLLKETPSVPFVVMNGDILTNVDFSGMLKYHTEQRAAATVATRTFEVEIPFGVIENCGDQITNIVEKPAQQYQVNAGIYVFQPGVLDWIETNVHRDMPNFLADLIGDGQRISGFPIHEYWIDIGRLEDFHKAEGDFADNFR